jgi:hypothetical protein
MGTKKGDFFKGIIGNLVFRVVNGKQVVSLRPVRGTYKQSKEGLKRSNTFGTASSLGAKIRTDLAFNPNNFFDGKVSSRLTAELYKTLLTCRDLETMHYVFEPDSFSRLSGFDFNIYSKVKEQLAENLLIVFEKGMLKVVIPKMRIPDMLNFPYKSFRCRLTVSPSVFRLRDGLALSTPQRQSITITKDMKILEEQILKFEVPDGCLCIVSLCLEYTIAKKSGWVTINNKKFSPACICAAEITKGEYEPDERWHWEESILFE